MNINELKNIGLDGVNPKDYPDFVDAFVDYAEHANGTPLTETELDYLNDNYPEVAQENAFESLI
jgi:hypothetical protein